MNKKKMWKRFFSLDRHHAEGFTLVELIVVIAILAILAGVAVPAYSGYITKANESVDLQNLSMLNNAFQVACVGNNLDPAAVNASLAWEGQTVVGLQTITPRSGNDPYEDTKKDFKEFIGDGIEFKIYTASDIKLVGGEFQSGVTKIYNGKEVFVSHNTIQAYKNSIWGTLPSEDVLGLVGNVSDMATTIENDTFLKMLDSEEYLKSAAAALGVSVADYEKTIADMVDNAEAEFLKANPSATQDEIDAHREAVGSQIMANNAILVAAKNSQSAGSSIMDLLTEEGGTKAKENIKKAMAGSDPATGLAQAALAYGLYNSYMLEKDPENFDTEQPMDFSTVMNTLTSTDFQTYLTKGNGQKDLDGYLAALDAVSSNSSSIGSDVVVNGFDDQELAALLTQVMGSGSTAE